MAARTESQPLLYRCNNVDLLYGYDHYRILSSERLMPIICSGQRYRSTSRGEGVNNMHTQNLRLAADHKLKNKDVASISYTDCRRAIQIRPPSLYQDQSSDQYRLPWAQHHAQYQSRLLSHIGLKAAETTPGIHDRSDYILLNSQMNLLPFRKAFNPPPLRPSIVPLLSNQTHT